MFNKFTAFDENKFKQALSEKDYPKLKIYTVCTIHNDPTFIRGEYDELEKTLEQYTPEIFVPYQLSSNESSAKPNDWTSDYFIELVSRFQNNFSKERIPHIREVGKVVHAETAKQYEESLQLSQPVETIKQNPPQPPVPPKRNLLKKLILTLLVLVAIILILKFIKQ